MTGPEPVEPWSATLTLATTVDLLARHPDVLAVAHLGSTGTDRWTDASDYDLLVVVDPGDRFGVESTLVDGRVADVVMAPRAAAARLSTAVQERDWPFLAWLAQARWVHDPDLVGVAAQESAARQLPERPGLAGPAPDVTRSFLTHDLRVAESLLRRTDPVARAALGMRQLHTFVAAVQAWSRLRGLHTQGWKADLARMADLDPDAFDTVQRWLGTADVHERHRLFRQMVDRALAPVGGPLPDRTVLPGAAATWDRLGRTGTA